MTDVVLRGWRRRTVKHSFSRHLPADVAGAVYGGGVFYAVKEYSSKESFYARLPNTRIADVSEKSIDAVVSDCLDKRFAPKVLPEPRKLLADNRYAAYY